MKTYFLQVQKVVRETEDAVSIHFWHPLSEQIKYTSGQFLTLIVPDGNGKRVRRSYSISSSPFNDSAVAITAKRVAGGIVSNYLNDFVKAGDFLEVIEPMGRFTYEPGLEKDGNIVLIGAGSGITPLFSILKTVLKSSDASVLLIYGNRTDTDIIFKKELYELESKYQGRFKILYILSRPPQNWVGHVGRINQSNAIWFMKENQVDFAKDLFYMCGPNDMMDELGKVYRLFDVPEHHIFYERFNAPMEDMDLDEVESLVKREITIVYNGETISLVVEPHQTVLEAALEQDIDLPYSCQAGMCTACLGKCVQGSVKMNEDEGLTDKEKAEGYILTCVSHPISENVIIEVD